MARFGTLLAGLALLVSGAAMAVVPAQDTHETVEQELSKPLIRGGIVFKSYCVLCHGDRGDGIARASRLHVGVNLTIRPRSEKYYENIIRNGGEAVGASPGMPPWRGELSDLQVADVIVYLKVVNDPVRRGEVVFKINCVLCHGVRGDGKGRAARLYDPRPADLTRSNKADKYKEAIIRFGGGELRRSRAMPTWNDRLSNAEIEDLIVYLRSIVVTGRR